MREELPEVVLTTTVSVDGRITLGRDQLLLDPTVAGRWSTMAVHGAFQERHAQIDAQAILEGSGSFVGPDAVAPRWPQPTVSDDVLWQDHLPTRAEKWFVVADVLKEGLVHIIDVVTLPGLVGGSGTPTMMDGAPLLLDDLPIRLGLSEVQVDGDAVRTRYRVRPLEGDGTGRRRTSPAPKPDERRAVGDRTPRAR